MKNIVVLGNFGYYNTSLNGQSMRTRSVFRLIKERTIETSNSINSIDTSESNGNMLNKIKFFIKFTTIIAKSNTVVIMPAQKALKLYFPLFSLVKLLTSKQVHYVVIGGWLSNVLQSKPSYVGMLRRFDSIHVQTLGLVDEMRSLGINRVYYLANFRFYNASDQMVPWDNKYKDKIVYYSRIIKEKGVENLIESLNQINLLSKREQVELDFYGPVADAYRFDFMNLISQFKFINYLGVLTPDDVINSLSRYQFLVFPSQRFFEEGFPGALLDAMTAGLPVVSTKWKYSSEFIIEGYNGITFDSANQSDLIEKMTNLLSNPELINQMSRNSLEYSRKFIPNNVGNELIKSIFT